jgi:hypothetical protein
MIGTDALVRQRQDVTVLRAARTPVTSWPALPGAAAGQQQDNNVRPDRSPTGFRGMEALDDTDRLQQHAV